MESVESVTQVGTFDPPGQGAELLSDTSSRRSRDANTTDGNSHKEVTSDMISGKEKNQ